MMSVTEIDVLTEWQDSQPAALPGEASPRATTVQREAVATGSAPGRPNGPANGQAVKLDGLGKAFGERQVLHGIDLDIAPGEFVAIIGRSGCGKSTLLRHLVGLREPAKGEVYYEGKNFTTTDSSERGEFVERFGVMYQSGALWSSLTLAENIAMPMEENTNLSPKAITELVSYKLALVGLSGYEDYYPSQISGGMNKRAGIARAMALDPDILFLDEPSAGLDPLSSRRLDDLILRLRDSLGSTIVVVTHELASIFAIANNSIFLDTATRTQGAVGNPTELRDHSDNPAVRIFLNRGEDTPPESTDS